MKPEDTTATLAGPPRACADEAERDVVEQPDHAGVLEEGTEQDEEEDVGRRDQVGMP